ncbi:hypothetical protein ONA91_25725 [Micromonospora sp. DR5-3]|uniref:hypothetical protein n=1 Tax=unclassified Micromonospora TaxID=2617518 RepID=UPI001651C385|nr:MULTISPECIES: hypothetical protein [unclassified Micromonospora]MCW3817853.1 hypothetical protein [Micromonospora sp. DR5-3]
MIRARHGDRLVVLSGRGMAALGLISRGAVRYLHVVEPSRQGHPIPPFPGRPSLSIVSLRHNVPGPTVHITDDTGREIRDGQTGASRVSETSPMVGYLTRGGIDARSAAGRQRRLLE